MDCGGLEAALATRSLAGTGFVPVGLEIAEPEVEFLQALFQYYRDAAWSRPYRTSTATD